MSLTLGLKILQLSCYNFIDLWAVSSPSALLQSPCSWVFFIFFKRNYKLIDISGWLPCYNFLDMWVVSTSIALLQCPWTFGCKFFNRLATMSLTFGLYFCSCLFTVFFGIWVVSPSIALLQFHWPFLAVSVALLQSSRRCGCKFFNCLATVYLTVGR